MKKLVWLIIISWFSNVSFAQCTTLVNAVPGITLTHQNTNCFNNSGVAYNPNLNLYYGVRAGNSGFPLETWTSTGTPLFNTTAGFDWRGMWWNPTLNQLEGNGYNSAGIWRANLNGSGHALNTGAVVLASAQPDPQSCGDLDYQAYEILYYFSGSIRRYSRTTGAFLGTVPLTGTPVALGNLNSTTLMYTGCAGKEIALLDYVNKRIYFYNKVTGAYNSMSQLPATAVTTASFRTSWANNYVWLFNLANFTWYSYQVLSVPLPVELLSFNATYNDGKVLLDWTTASEINNDYFIIERSSDAINFEEIGRVNGAGNSNFELYYNETDDSPLPGISYYRLKQIDFDGTDHYSDLATIMIGDENTCFVYPNPASSELRIGGNLNGITQVIVTNEMGSMEKLDFTAEWKSDISNLRPGIYFVHIQKGSQTTVEKFVVQ